MRLTLPYSLFCALAIAVNIGTQEAVVRLGHWLQQQLDMATPLPGLILLSIAAGTGTGLVVKYLLDKRYIFRFQPQSAAHDGKTFVRYTLMGLATTLIFWGFEYGFWLIFQSATMRYLGGVIGLVLGYISKYHLDKQFVFTPAAAGSQGRSA